MTTKLLTLLLGALSICCPLALGATPLPSLSQISGGQGVVLEGQGPETVWDANSQPLSADPTAANVTLRRATLRGALLLAPTRTVPLALATSGAFSGPWYLEDILIYMPTCDNLEAFANLTCDLQPATWISSSGWSVTIASFTGGGFTSTNVTLFCDPPAASPDSSPPSSSSNSTPPVRRPACVTLTAKSSAELLALMLYNVTQPSGGGAVLPPSPSRLHIALTANISLDLDAWTAARPVVTRPLTTISPTDCRRVTAMDLRGGISIMTAKGGGILRFLCLELSNLATDTLGTNMPRSLLSGAVWAVDVEIPRGSRLVVENSSLVLTVDEFKWQSYYMAQALSNTVVFGSVSSVLANFQGIVSPSQLLWVNVSSPHTRWRNVIITSLPRVYETVVPNSFIMRYLGLSLYLTDLKMVYSCDDLLRAVRNGSGVAVASAAATPPQPRVLVLGANISIGPCWPATSPVIVADSSLMIMGLPDVTTTLDLAGRSDALELASDTTLSIRFLTLIGLGVHDAADNADMQMSITSSPSHAPASSAVVANSPWEHVSRATALLWAFNFVRQSVHMQLESVSIVVPAVELEQYKNMHKGLGVTVPYFSVLSVYLTASSSAAVQPYAAIANSSQSGDTVPRVLASLIFDSLLLPGIRGTGVAISVWSGQYGNWSASMYDVSPAAGGDAASQGGGGGGGIRLEGWRVGVLVAAIGLAVLTVLVAALLYGKRYRAAKSGGGASTAAAAAAKRRGDIEAGVGGRTSAEILSVVASGRAGGTAAAAPRSPLYDSFDDPVFELDLVRGAKLSPDDVADVLDRVNVEAAEFNIQMTEICGSGAFGVVYGGMWHGLKVAIKTMVFSETAPQQLGGQLARQQCIREAAFCCTMHHPNVVATHHYYLKSTKRHTMFDDIMLQTDDNSSDEGDLRRRRTQPLADALPAALPAAPAPSPVVANVATADEAILSANRGTGDCNNPSAVAGSPAAAAPAVAPAAAAPAAPGRLIAPRRDFKKSALPRFQPVSRAKAAVTDWRLYLIQEYCDGGTLRQAVDAGKLFRHSGIKRLASGAAAPAAAAAGGAETKANGQRPMDSLDAVQTIMIFGKQGQVTYDKFAAQGCTNATAAAGEDIGAGDANADGGRDGAAADAHDDESTVFGGSLGPIDDPEAGARQPDQQRSAAAAAEMPRHNAVQCLRRPTTMTLDSNFMDTTATNATADSMILDTTTNCSETGIAQAPLPPLRPSSPAQPPAASLGGGGTAAAPPPLQAGASPEEALPADLALVVHTALGIASGVAYLHSRSIIHGDLSANNVLLMHTRMEEVPVLAKLSDFGLSMRLEQGQDHLKDVHHGTPYYQSPEVVEHGTCSLAADVYSLGVLLWEVYHGPPPWRSKKHKVRKPRKVHHSSSSEGQPSAALAAAAAAAAAANAAADEDLWDDPHYRLRACDTLVIAPQCPERYARVLRRCLSPDPRDRPSARAVVKSLLRMERSLAAAAAASGDRAYMTGAPVGAMMALTRPERSAGAGPGRALDASLLLEDFDAAAAAVAAAVARVTAAPTVAGAPASAGAAAVVAAAGAASDTLQPILDSSPQLVAAKAAAARQRPGVRAKGPAARPAAAATVEATASTNRAAASAVSGAAVETLE